MLEKVTGLVVETKRRHCVLLTPDGDFVEAAAPSGQNPKIGEELTLNRYQPLRLVRSMALAACLFIAVLGWTAYSTSLPVAVAYVSLDINPSLELAIGRQGQVVSATGFNPEAETLLQQAAVQGKPVNRAIESLIEAAVNLNYIDPNRTNGILVTVEVEPQAPTAVVSQKSLEDIITRTITKKNMNADLSVTPVAPAVRQQANQQKMSTGRYLLFQELQRQGKPIELKEIKDLDDLDDLDYQKWSPGQVKHIQHDSDDNPKKKNGQSAQQNQNDRNNHGENYANGNQSLLENDSDNEPDRSEAQNWYNRNRQRQQTRSEQQDDDSDDYSLEDSSSKDTDDSDDYPWYDGKGQSRGKQRTETIKRPAMEKWREYVEKHGGGR